uniref:Intraflagellar transport protein 46 homolog n=1 Tax=Schizaphis graminum TaxID=13262 RepID=A0A2S2PUH9_SCHGA
MIIVVAIVLEGLLKVVKKLESAEKNPKVIDQWIRDINELNRGKTSAFFYSKKMPDVETIMEPWMGDSNQKSMPDFENADLLTLIDEVCDYFGIPKTDTKVESLHLLFSVYLAIKNSRAQNTTVLASDNSS